MLYILVIVASCGATVVDFRTLANCEAVRSDMIAAGVVVSQCVAR